MGTFENICFSFNYAFADPLTKQEKDLLLV